MWGGRCCLCVTEVSCGPFLEFPVCPLDFVYPVQMLPETVHIFGLSSTNLACTDRRVEVAIPYVVPQSCMNGCDERTYLAGERLISFNCQIRDDFVPHLCDFFVL